MSIVSLRRPGARLPSCALALLIWAACDPPDVQEGLSCADGERCPSGQTCVDNLCRFTADTVDAGADGGVFACDVTTVAMGEDTVQSIDLGDPDSIYWTAEGSDRILRTARTSEDVATYIFQDDEPNAHPWGLALDDTFVYWGQNRVGGRILRKPRTGGAVEELAVGQDRVKTIVLDDANVYYATVNESETGSLWRLPKAGGTPAEIASGQTGPLHLALDEEWLYWSNNAGNQVMKHKKDGSGPTLQLKGGQEGIRGLTIDSDTVYWVNETEGVVASTAKDGGDRIVIASEQVGVRDIAVDADFVYWSNYTSGEIHRVPLDDHDPVQTIATEQLGVQALAIDGDDLYWLNSLDSENRLVHASMGSCRLQ